MKIKSKIKMLLANHILITGSEGKVGKIIREHLEKLGYQLKLLDKKKEKNPVDILTDEISQYFTNIETAIHLAANPDPFISKEEADKNIELTKIVIEVCKQSPSIGRIVNASSINVYPFGDTFEAGERLTDTTPLSPNTIFGNRRTDGHYGKAKIISESLLEQYCSENNVSLINLRLGCVTADDRTPRQPDGTIAPIEEEIALRHKDLITIVEKSLTYDGIVSYVCVSKTGGLVDRSIQFPL